MELRLRTLRTPLSEARLPRMSLFLLPEVLAVRCSSNAARHGSVQYSQMAIPQLIAVCTFEPSEGAWSEFVRRFQPLIVTVITRVVRRFRNVSSELVDDLTQDVFLKLFHANFRILRNFETHHENAFVGFLKVVASNTAQDYFRNAASADGGFRKSSEADLVSRICSHPPRRLRNGRKNCFSGYRQSIKVTFPRAQFPTRLQNFLALLP